ncbi:MAG TPA: hypothetical protein VJT75_01400 [Thermoleophilaceae bacterium]|nr:hypothetical protein [Thermoleophilaceae bacterium]
MLPAAGAGAKKPPTRITARFPANVQVQKPLVATGTVTNPGRGASVRLQQSTGGRWVQRARSGLKKGKFTLKWTVPAKAGGVTLRAAVVRGGKVVAATTARHVLVKRRVAVISPDKVSSAPTTGARGTIVVDGDSSAKAGDVVAMGTGPNTPYGFLGKVASVSHSDGDTQITTEPTTLLDAVPTGQIDTTVTPGLRRVKGKGRVPRLAKQNVSKVVSCEAGGSVEVHGSVTVTPSVKFKAHWHWDWRPWNNGVDTASLTGTLTADAELAASAQAAASCSIDKTQIAQINLPPIDLQVGPVPVVLVPRILVYVSAEGSVSATVSTGIRGTVSGTAGIHYDDGDFDYDGNADASWSYDPPNAQASAELGGRIIPAFQMLLYGVAGPELAFSTGLQFSADTDDDPWWTLTAPVDLNASLKAPLLKLDSGELNLFHHDFPIAEASDDPPEPDRTDVATLTWNTEGTDIDLHVFDAQGNHAWFSDHGGVPDATLSDDDTDGIGPEVFAASFPNQQWGFGLCYYADHNDGDATVPTNATIDWRDPSSGQTTTQSAVLSEVGQTAVFGATSLVPAGDEWC